MHDITQLLEKTLTKQSEITGAFIKEQIDLAISQLKDSMSKSSLEKMVEDTYGDLVGWIKTELGHPVIKINVDDKHYAQAIQNAIQMWWEHHYDGSHIIYVAIPLTKTDIDNNSVDISSYNIDRVTNVIVNRVNRDVLGSSIAWIEYDTALSYSFSSIYASGGKQLSLSSMLATQHHLGNMNRSFSKPVLFNFKKYPGVIEFKDDSISMAKEGDVIMVEGYINVPLSDIVDILKDPWVKAYAKERLKLIWGTILKAIKNVPLLGGVQPSGDELYDEAKQEIDKLERDLINKYEEPAMFYFG